MSKSNTVLFKRSLIAAAVLSLSACSSMPRGEDSGLSRVGDGIITAGRTTADVSKKVWNKTTYLLGFSDDDGENVSDEGLLMDANDVALLDDGTAAARDTIVRPIVIRSAIPTGQDQTPINENLDQQIQTPTNTEQLVDADLASLQSQQTPMDAAPLSNPAEVAPFQEDLIHEVAPSETLWDIAKLTTGDANNWHVLADTNNLGPGASVFPGQQLIIPAGMVKSEYDTSPNAASNEQTAEKPYVDTQNLAGNAATVSTEQQPVSATVSDAASTAIDQQITGKPFKVNPGETLWDFSKRVTGDATNWQAIAGQNQFSDKQASYVRTGQTIYVPEALIRPELDAALSLESGLDSAEMAEPALEKAQELQDTGVDQKVMQNDRQDELAITVITSASAAARQSNDSVGLDTSADMLADRTSMLDEAQPIKIIEATFKASKNTAVLPSPSASSSDSAQLAAPVADDNAPAEIMVSGTYYPKAVYNEADFSSSLLMRVSPGTTLTVSKPMGSWYQVKTEKGLGYVHQRDIR